MDPTLEYVKVGTHSTHLPIPLLLETLCPTGITSVLLLLIEKRSERLRVGSIIANLNCVLVRTGKTSPVLQVYISISFECQ